MKRHVGTKFIVNIELKLKGALASTLCEIHEKRPR
jgi:hypothetical protein